MNYAAAVIKIQSIFSIWKIWFLWSKITYFFSKCMDALICIKKHQNVCRMNCTNGFCMKLLKKWFLFHIKGPKLTKYIYHGKPCSCWIITKYFCIGICSICHRLLRWCRIVYCVMTESWLNHSRRKSGLRMIYNAH